MSKKKSGSLIKEIVMKGGGRIKKDVVFKTNFINYNDKEEKV